MLQFTEKQILFLIKFNQREAPAMNDDISGILTLLGLLYAVILLIFPFYVMGKLASIEKMIRQGLAEHGLEKNATK